MSDPNRYAIDDINDPDFFSDENIDALSEPASYADWAPGPSEIADGSAARVKPRPVGDSSYLVFGDGVDEYDIDGSDD